jgi:hypothetical protein
VDQEWLPAIRPGLDLRNFYRSVMAWPGSSSGPPGPVREPEDEKAWPSGSWSTTFLTETATGGYSSGSRCECAQKLLGVSYPESGLFWAPFGYWLLCAAIPRSCGRSAPRAL